MTNLATSLFFHQFLVCTVQGGTFLTVSQKLITLNLSRTRFNITSLVLTIAQL